MPIQANLITRFVTYSKHVLNWSKIKLVEIGNFSQKEKRLFLQLSKEHKAQQESSAIETIVPIQAIWVRIIVHVFV